MSSKITRWLLEWNKKLHLYLGLYFLVFLWLFTASGLLLNHAWNFAEFWSQRRQSTTEHTIVRPQAEADLGRAHDLMRQLGVAGEVEWTTAHPRPDRFDFRVVCPGWTLDVKADFAKQTAEAQEIRVNGWGVIRALHTFNGVRSGSARGERDWWLTRLWSFSMDALAVGLILLVVSSLAMACEQREKWLLAGLTLAAGTGICGFFVFGLRWL